MFIFRRFFDGRPCSSWRYPDILVSPGEDPGRSWGHLGCLQELLGVLGEACTRLECQKGGPGNRIWHPREGARGLNSHIIEGF
jgi:hypothetical protein